MSGRTGIEWTDRTWNPVVGCTKVSQGCKLCYAKTIHDMRHKAWNDGKVVAPQYAKPFEVVQLRPERLRWPISLREPSRIFVNSVSDLFHEDVPDEFIDRVFAVMALASRHTFQVLTKRPDRMLKYLTDETLEARRGHLLAGVGERIALAMLAFDKDAPDVAWPLPNVWLGVSVENQDAANERIPILLQTPAAVRFLSCEPLIGPVDLKLFAPFIAHLGAAAIECEHGRDACPICDRGIDWVIAGGESGSSKQNPRPMHPDWARSLRDQCVAAGVPFLFKQWGDWVTENQAPSDAVLPSVSYDFPRDSKTQVWRAGKKNAGRELDGRTWDEYPATAQTVAP